MTFISPPGATPLTQEALEGLIPDHILTQKELNEWEAANIAIAQRWTLSLPKHKEILTLQFATRLHKKMFDQTWRWAGSIRTTQTNIGIPAHQIIENLQQTFDNVRYWTQHKTYAMDEIAARLHHSLVWIHPFLNGNGRHGRLMADLFLMQQGSRAFSWGTEDLSNQSGVRDKYLKALHKADRHEFDELLAFVRS